MTKIATYTRIYKGLSRTTKITVAVTASLLLIGASMSLPRIVSADTAQQQISALQNQNSANNKAAAALAATATSYQDAISKLKAQINAVAGQIAANEAQQADIQRQINQAQVQLDQQRSILGDNIKAMYLEGHISTVEMLATSKNLSDFVDKETYRNTVQSKIQDTMAKVQTLQNTLNGQKQQIDALIATQQQQRESLDSANQQQASLLAMNQSQQAAYNQQTASNKAKIATLQAEIDAQRQANNIRPDGGYYFIRFPGTVGNFDPGNYPWRNSGFSMSPLGCGYVDSNGNGPDSTDSNGYCTRQCVSYAAWAVEASGRTAPRGYGSAKNWINSAPSSWIYRTPQVGDIAISTAGTWGHAMYVEQVSGDQIYVSEYNQQLTGTFRYQWREWR